MKKLEKKVVGKQLTKHEMKILNGGLLHGACVDGMTFTGTSYSSSICQGHGGLAYIIVVL
jgi:hypothetical protein